MYTIRFTVCKTIVTFYWLQLGVDVRKDTTGILLMFIKTVSCQVNYSLVGLYHEVMGYTMVYNVGIFHLI